MPSGSRVVSFHSSWAGYRLVADWAARHGHELALVVTPSVEASIRRYGGDVTPLASRLPAEQPVLATDRLVEVAAPAIARLEPELVISAIYPRLIPAQVLAVPEYGGVNVHPSALPRGRGPNPQRLIYEGDTRAGATLHRTSASFDTGAILSQRERPLPSGISAAGLRELWSQLWAEVLEEGVERLFAGEPGVSQDESLATSAAAFTQEERWLDLTEPTEMLQRRLAGLNLAAPSALTRLGEQELMVLSLEAVSGTTDGEPGTLIRWEEDETVLVHTGDGTARLRIC
jgi:methionyl-tRNA formyltransferase